MRHAVRSSSPGLLGVFLLLLAAPVLAAPTPKAWLGVTTQELSDELRDALDIKNDGVLVNRVVTGSPAEKAGMRKGDVILSINDHSVGSPAALADAVSSAAVGSTAALRVVRRGSIQNVSAKLAARPDSLDNDGGDDWSRSSTHVHVWRDGKEISPDNGEIPGLEGLRHLDGLGAMPRMVFFGRGRLGIRTASLNSDLSGYFGGTNGKGALVLEVLKDTPAEKAGIKAGDVITRVDNQDVQDSDDLVRALRDEEGKVTITVVRKGAKRTVEAELENGQLGPRTYRYETRTPGSSHDDDELRREMQELRDQIRDLKQQLEDKNH
jgi:membrane-associated protease RseP (regulator of RpoE activity)